jgi:putative transposase
MCLRFVFLLITRLAAWLRLSRCEEAQKTAEILILRHQLAVLQRHQPRRTIVDWADRALFATRLGVIPRARRRGLRLPVTPDTILRWHRDIVRHRWAARSMSGKTGRPVTLASAPGSAAPAPARARRAVPRPPGSVTGR